MTVAFLVGIVKDFRFGLPSVNSHGSPNTVGFGNIKSLAMDLVDVIGAVYQSQDYTH